jgi:hemerythrin
MALLVWNDTYSLGIASIDEQHKKILDMINELSLSLINKEDESRQVLVLLKLTSYTISHFRHEENIFDKYNYEETDEHKESHKKLIERVDDFQTRLTENKEDIGEELLGFLITWLLNHILLMDKRYMPFMTQNGIS